MDLIPENVVELHDLVREAAERAQDKRRSASWMWDAGSGQPGQYEYIPI